MIDAAPSSKSASKRSVTFGSSSRRGENAGEEDVAAKRILYFGPSPTQFEALVEAMAQLPDCRWQAGDSTPLLEYAGRHGRWVAEYERARVIDRLGHEFINLLVLDLRCPGDEICFERQAAETFGILTALDDVEDLETRYGFHRIMVLVSGRSPDLVDQTILDLGARGVGRVLRQRFVEHSDGRQITDPGFAARVLEHSHELMFARHRKRRALCAAGGGVTGIYFEMGSLKCLDDCLPGDALGTFDMYFGISAGAVVTGLMAAGYSMDEFMAAVAGVDGGRLPRIDMRVFRLSHINYPDVARRLGAALRSGWSTVWNTLRDGFLPTLDDLFFQYADVIGAPFRADGFEQLLRTALTAPGATNDFRHLPRKLYIGATDQDERRHQLFGVDGRDTVEISVAIQASMSLNPAFAATQIEGRYYEDGAVTRTSNFAEAIRRGADLIFTIDPMVPYVSLEPGFAARRGMLYNVDQNLRTISYTRFETTRNWILRRHPDVSSYTFVPANRVRRLLSISPFDHRPYLEIWRAAYLSTLLRVQNLAHRMRGDLAFHGITLDTGRAEAVAERLSATKHPTLADFFPDGRIEIKQPPLCLETPEAWTTATHQESRAEALS